MSAGEPSDFRPTEFVVEAVKGGVEAVYGATVGSTTQALARQAIRSFVAEMNKSWLLPSDAEEGPNQYTELCDEVLRRIDENEAEERHPLLISMREKSVDPTEWPEPPTYEANKLQWLRCKLLYSLCPADRDMSYALRHERSLLILPLLLVCPGIATFTWLLVIAVKLTVRRDPYQLLNGIWTYKLFLVLLWGLLPVIEGHVSHYALLTDPSDPTSCADLARGHFLPSFVRDTMDSFITLKLGVFYLNWLLCYALYLKARQSIALKAQGDSLDLFTNEADVDTKALEWLLR